MAETEFRLGSERVANLRQRRIGMIVPASNTNAEPDCQMLAPAGLTLHVTRSGGYEVEAIPDADEMRRFARQALDQQLQLLVDARVELVAYACTSATLADGPEFDREFCAEISAKSGLPAVTTAGALVEAIKAVGARRVGFTSPYVKPLADESIEFLRRCDIETVNRADFERALSSLEQNALTPDDAYEIGLEADHPEAQAVVISCTDFRALEAVPALEATLGKPVITSNSALMYACLERPSIESAGIEAGGFLFTRRN